MEFRAWLGTVVRAALSPVMENRGGWWPWVSEPYTGAWQKNDERWTNDTVLAHSTVYACVNRIANDMGKLHLRLVEKTDDGIWVETKIPAYARVLRSPNHYQTWVQFREAWSLSKLLRGNTYCYIDRDGRDVPRALHVLDASRVTVLVGPDGDIFYELKADDLAGVADVTVPAEFIIHDRINCLFHPLVGTSPIFACGMSAHMGLTIGKNQSAFFRNGSRVSGQLLIPTAIGQEKTNEYRERWEANFTGPNAKQLAVLSGGMKFEPIQMTNVDAQLIDQLQWTAEDVCRAFNVPPWKVHVGQQPAYTKPEISNQAYYQDCLQSHIEQFEAVLDEAFGFLEPRDNGVQYGFELDLDGLLRMDEASQVTTLTTAISGSLLTVNDARKRFGMAPVEGGDSIYMQQQNYDLKALAERDRNSPLLPQPPAPPALPAPAEDDADEAQATRAMYIRARTRNFRMRTAA